MDPAITILNTRLLDLQEDGVRPAEQARYQTGNELTRTLAHLAGTTGSVAKLIRVTDAGAVKIDDAALVAAVTALNVLITASNVSLTAAVSSLTSIIDKLDAVTSAGVLKVHEQGA